jgi:hypothetical protein
MRAFFFAIASFALLGGTASADSLIAVLPQSVHQAVHYRVTRTIQGFNGPETTTQNFALMRRDASNFSLERTDAHSVPTAVPLKIGADGMLTLANAGADASPDAALNDALFAFDAALVAMKDATGAAHDSWAAYVPVSPAKGAQVAAITFVPANVAGSELDFYGTGQAVAATGAASVATASASPEPERRGGGRRGGGFGGGGYRGRPGGDEAAAGPGAVSTSLHVEGHISAKRVTRIAMTETRTVTVQNLPFVNVSSWSITIVK